MKRAILIIIDGGGVGELPDAAQYGDTGANTFGNLYKTIPNFNLPNLFSLGLRNLITDANDKAEGFFGKAAEKAAGKDSTSGHWEIAGQILENPLPTYPQGFPKEVLDEFTKKTGYGVIGNYPASGTEIIKELGHMHLETGNLIVYTSQDSVFQIAAHRSIVPVPKLYLICEVAREILRGKHEVGRVIARPFDTKDGEFYRTPERHDYSITPSEDIVPSKVLKAGFDVTAIGKIYDIYDGMGISEHILSRGNTEGLKILGKLLRQRKEGLIMLNLVDFDMIYGHRRNPEGFYKALQEFDNWLPELLGRLYDDELFIITADHGTDPTFMKSTDHTREYVPILGVYKGGKSNVNLGSRSSYSDIGATFAEYFGVESTGKSFLRDIK